MTTTQGFIIFGVMLGITIIGAVAFLWTTRPSKRTGTSAKDSVLHTWQWKQAAILGAGPMLTALIGWQLWTLDPRAYCRVATEDQFAAMEQIEKLETCKEVILQVLAIKDHALIGLMVILGGIIAMLTVSEFKTRLKASGPMGSSIEIGQDRAPKE